MSLPSNYNNISDYLKECIKFLRTYQWLYSTPNTHILSKKLLDNFPIEWQNILKTLSTEELNNIPIGYINTDWPEALKNFLTKINSLKPEINYEIQKYDFKLTNQFFKGLNQKKIHEIQSFAPYINETCKLFNTDVIIDIGAGLGYLPELLHKLYGFNILAIEADEKKVETAKKRQNELYKESINHVKYIQHFVDDNSAEYLQKLIEDCNFPDSDTDTSDMNVCLVGLHACADLTITLLKLFSQMSRVKQAIVMPCCYHRLKKLPDSSENEDYFQNFPVSYSLWNLYDDEHASKFLTGAFLRLACQNTAASWRTMSQEDHRIHSIAAMRRAVFQLVADTEGYNIKRLKRKTSSEPNFEQYLNHLKATHSVTNTNNGEEMIDTKEFLEKMTKTWEIHEQNCQLIEAYTAIQTSLQNICENIILLDRVEMMKEWGFQCFARKITDEAISPRCYAIVARKPTH